MAFDIEMIKKAYDNVLSRVNKMHQLIDHMLVLTLKKLSNDLWNETSSGHYKKDLNLVNFTPNRVVYLYVRA